MGDLVSTTFDMYWLANREKNRLKKQLRITRDALREIASEECTYAGHGADDPFCGTNDYDPECPGTVCWAKKALKEARKVPYVNR